MKLTIRFKGGLGSGHHGHAGRKGQEGGSLPGKSMNSSTDTISWDGKDVFALSKTVKNYFDTIFPEIYSSEEKRFYKAVEDLLDRSNIKLSDGDWDELGQYFDAWVFDAFNKD
ncbi:MAG: hypothetical protein WC479_00635 [Candidatus Izemoplasmatales bacterium]